MGIPEKGEEPLSVIRSLVERRTKDPNYIKGEVLGSMITQPSEIAIEAYKIFIDTNLNDPLLFPETAKLEYEVIRMVSTLLKNPKPLGLITYGGSESNITAMYTLREMRRGSVIIAPMSIHFSIHKAAKILGLRVIEVGLDEGYRADISEIETQVRRYRDNVVAIALTAGTTELGVVDPIAEVGKIAEDFGIPIHVDAAYGGFIIPFLKMAGYKLPDFDFSIQGVETITLDPHKCGLAPIPSSLLLFRSEAIFSKIYFTASYMPTGRQKGLLGTRCGGVAAATWAILRATGIEGYIELSKKMLKNAKLLAKLASESGFELVIEPILPIVCIKLPKPKRKIFQYLWSRKLYAYPSSMFNAIRVVVMPHIREAHIHKFIDELKKAVEKVK
ncbi:MAG: tyrosine decarboxylase MfnA [Thermoprotei archaeon]|nr:MAG: tyrosine decarboxylase MfnA [Thermoprotei archaeon]